MRIAKSENESHLETTLAMQLEALGVEAPAREFRFHPTRRWRFDFAWPQIQLAVEVEGGANGGRHTRRVGFEGDMEKYHEAMAMGWDVYRCGRTLVLDGRAAQLVAKLIQRKRGLEA
jgi:very-short-patch-repair endonuclease